MGPVAIRHRNTIQVVVMLPRFLGARRYDRA